MRYLLTALLLLCATTTAQAGVFVGFGGAPAVNGVTIGLTSTPREDDTAFMGAGAGVSQVATATETGYVNRVCAFLRSTASASAFNVAIYNADRSERLADGTLTTDLAADQYVCVALDSAIEVTAETSYQLVVGSSNDTYWAVGTRYNYGGVVAYANVSMTVANAMPTSLSGGTVEAYEQAMIYADYQ